MPPSQYSTGSVVPAQLSFLTIYNPNFGATDETAIDQILYYCSKRDLDRDRAGSETTRHNAAAESKSRRAPKKEDEDNDRLRKVGLARGMVEFANTFSNGVAVDSIETEKSRLVLQELESNWWILASIDLTRLPAASRNAATKEDGEEKEAVEYSSREVSSPQLLLKQLQRAHSLFMMHHAASLDELYSRLGRDLFCGVLEKYWNNFVWDWDVLLHGNPAVDIYNATKLASGGELGIGVGEEEWGSGEREVLEDFAHRTEGLVDVVVGRYGNAPAELKKDENKEKNGDGVNTQLEPDPWLGMDEHVKATDGIIFTGVGALSKRSLATVSQWMEAIFRQGENTYGIGDNPSSRPRHRRKIHRHVNYSVKGDTVWSRKERSQETHPRVLSPRGSRKPDLRKKAMENNATSPGIPAPLVGTVERSLNEAVANVQKKGGSQAGKDDAKVQRVPSPESAYFDTDKMVNYLKLGYGSSWTLNPKGFSLAKDEVVDVEQISIPSASDDQEQTEAAPLEELDPTPDVSDEEVETDPPFVQRLEQSIGKFLVGLSGDLENTEFDDDQPSGDDAAQETKQRRNSQRLFMRTLNLQLSRSHYLHNEETRRNTTISEVSSLQTKLRVVIYVHQPFIFTFLFTLNTSQLSIPSFYRSIHHQLGPLQKPLLRSTDPSRIPERIALHISINSSGNSNASGADAVENLGLYDLIYDPVKLTIRTGIPPIPLPGTLAAEGIHTSSAGKTTVSGAWYTLGIPIGASPITQSSISTSGPYSSAPAGQAVVRTNWTRIEALNVHTQILSTYAATHPSAASSQNVIDPSLAAEGEFERTVKTSRGWWIMWLRVPRSLGESSYFSSPSTFAAYTQADAATPATAGRGDTTPTRPRPPRLRRDETDESSYVDGAGEHGREALLVRKTLDSGVREGTSRGGAGSSSSTPRWLRGRETSASSKNEVGGGGGGGRETSARGVVEGLGVDARRWVEAVSRLS